MKKYITCFNISVAVFLSIFLLFSTLGILFSYWGNSSAVTDSLGTVANFFGGFSTLIAAFIAIFLYTDWREQLSTSAQQQQANSTLLTLNKILVKLDEYGTFIYMHTGMGHESYYMKEADEKALTLIQEYKELKNEFKMNLLHYQNIFLDGISILNDDDEVKIDWYYFGIVNCLSRIKKEEHLKQPDNFQLYINALKRDRNLFKEVKAKVDHKLVKAIKALP